MRLSHPRAGPACQDDRSRLSAGNCPLALLRSRGQTRQLVRSIPGLRTGSLTGAPVRLPSVVPAQQAAAQSREQISRARGRPRPPRAAVSSSPLMPPLSRPMRDSGLPAGVYIPDRVPSRRPDRRPGLRHPGQAPRAGAGGGLRRTPGRSWRRMRAGRGDCGWSPGPGRSPLPGRPRSRLRCGCQWRFPVRARCREGVRNASSPHRGRDHLALALAL